VFHFDCMLVRLLSLSLHPQNNNNNNEIMVSMCEARVVSTTLGMRGVNVKFLSILSLAQWLIVYSCQLVVFLLLYNFVHHASALIFKILDRKNNK
jgi:hypothetical protein